VVHVRSNDRFFDVTAKPGQRRNPGALFENFSARGSYHLFPVRSMIFGNVSEITGAKGEAYIASLGAMLAIALLTENRRWQYKFTYSRCDFGEGPQRPRAPLIFSLHAHDTQEMPQVLGIQRRKAAGNPAIRPLFNYTAAPNLQISDKEPVR